jgi:hypothetical protein
MRISAMLKRITSITVVFMALLFPSLASAAELTLTPATATINKGCTLSVAITLNTQGQDTDGTDVELLYDTTKFSISNGSIVNGTIYPDYPLNAVTNGRISVAGISSPTQPYNGSGTFATINVTVPTSASGVGTIKFEYDPNDKTKTTDTNVFQSGTSDTFDILSRVSDGTYTIGTGTTCTGSTAPAGNNPGTTSGTGAPGSKTLPAGNTGTGGVGRQLPMGGPASSESANLPYTQLPAGGIEGPTLILTIIGGALTVLGIIGLSLL